MIIAEAGANASPCSNIYAGSMPFSEPEVAGIRDFINWQVPDLKLYISLHSYGQIWLAPWGYTSTKPTNHEDQVGAINQRSLISQEVHVTRASVVAGSSGAACA